MPGESQRIFRSIAAFVAGAALAGLGVAIMLRLPPPIQMTALCVSLVVGGGFAAAVASTSAWFRRVLSVACTAVGYALGGTWFTLLTVAEGNSGELCLASMAGWGAAGFLVACGFAGWDRRLWLLLIGPAAFAVGGAMSWLLLGLVQPTEASIVIGVIAAPALGGVVFGTVTELLAARVRVTRAR